MTARKLVSVSMLVLTSLAVLTGIGSATDRNFRTTVGPNVNITKTAGSQAEGTIAINPTNPLQLFAGYNPPGATFMRSLNGGATWIAAGAGIGASCCDEVAAWDSFGNLFVVNINGALNAIVLYLSIDGGANFSLLSTIDTGSVDQPSVKAGAGSVWVTWNDAGTIKARGASVTSLGAIGAFSAEQTATGSSTVGGQFGDIAVGPSGQVVVTYQSSTTSTTCPCNIYVNTDADGLGAGGFGSQVLATATNVSDFDTIPAQDSRTIDAEANLAWDRFNGRLYLVYTDEFPDESNDTDIYLRYSDDNGATWSARLKVNDDATTRSQFLPNVSVDQTTGNLAVSWHDARNDPGNNNTQFWGAVSRTNFVVSPGNVAFGPNFQISAGTSNDDTAGSSTDYGDYTWGDSYGGTFHPIWSDNSNSTGDNPAGANSTFDMYTATVTMTPPAPVVADYNGNGSTDVAVWRPSNGFWYVQGGVTSQWGLSTDIPVLGDFNGNFSTDIAVWRPSTGVWYVKGGATVQWGFPTDIPVPGDYNGNYATDIAVWRPATGVWYVNGGATVQWGFPTDIPVPGDYNGNGTTDIAVWRPSNGFWYVNGGATVQWGAPTDIPVPGDYNGDGITDIAVWRPSTGVWYVNGGATQQWGVPTDIPVPGDYDANGTTDIAVWRPSTGFFYVRNGVTTQWGFPTDIPVARYPRFP